MTEAVELLGRLAMRREGDNWVAYYALPDSFKGPVFLGSIRVAAVIGNPERQKAFIAIMCDVLTEIIENTTGVRPTWGEPEVAAEHERAGQG